MRQARWFAAAVVVVSMVASAAYGVDVSAPPPHPFMVLSPAERGDIAKRVQADPIVAECWQRIQDTAAEEDKLGGSPGRGGDERANGWCGQLEARALLWQATGDKVMGERAVALMRRALQEVDPTAYYEKAEFHFQATPLRALALGWDLLYDRLTPEQRAEMLPKLEHWVDVAYRFTDKQWWREASYNVGAIPVSGYGILALAIGQDSKEPIVRTAYLESARRIGQNYFPNAWKPSGICYEGPNYAIVGLRYASFLAEAMRRAGGPDLLADSGARLAMKYEIHQWLPMGGCAPIGDNTDYGRRTFAAEYLLGMGRTADAESLWMWQNLTQRRSLDPIITVLWYPLGLTPRSPVEAKLPTSHYFEVTPFRAGYVFGRTAWDDPQAGFFAFTTRFERCNHQHYDMNGFLLGGYGTLFATHRLLYPYGHVHQGVDYEHNHVVIEGEAWPVNNTPSCSDDNSTNGNLVGLALGEGADYVRGDAKFSYRDNTVSLSGPAIRAERSCLFVKGPQPYLLSCDDIQFTDKAVNYDWLWYAPKLPITGSGTLADPVVIAAKDASCAIHFLTPAQPAITVVAPEVVGDRASSRPSSRPSSGPASGPTSREARLASRAASLPAEERRGSSSLLKITAALTGTRVQYVAIATMQKDLADKPAVAPAAVQCIASVAGGATVTFKNGPTDTLVWQSEEDRVQTGYDLTCGQLQTDGLTAMVRVEGGKVTGYVLGEGTYLRWNGRALVTSAGGPVSVSAGPDGVHTSGRMRTREGLPTVEPTGVKTEKP